jgi:hypothetical protein
MKRKNWSLMLVAGLVASSLSMSPAGAQDAPVVVPDVVQIDDPVGDANFINDQDNAYGTPAQGLGDNDAETIGNATDIRKVWFTHTATEVSLNVQLNGNPSGLAYDTYFRFSSNVGEGSVAADALRGCLQWVSSVNGTTAGAYNGPTEGALTDKCNVGTPVAGPLAISEGPDGTFVMTTTFPRSYSPLLAEGAKLTAPFGVSRIVYANGLPQLGSAAYATIDNTKRGTDYAVTASAGEAPGEPVKPPKKPKPSKAKGCDKGKGKKKGCRPAPPPAAAACPPYVPGTNGAKAELVTVTDAATKDSPVVVEFEAGRGLALAPVLGVPFPDLTAHNYHNIQVDSANPETGLYVRLEFPQRHDYDLYLQYPDGTEADHSGDASATPESPVHSCGGTSCSSDATHEQISGIATPDCGGWTTDSVAYLTPGGKITMKVWLGEVLADPAPPKG